MNSVSAHRTCGLDPAAVAEALPSVWGILPSENHGARYES